MNWFEIIIEFSPEYKTEMENFLIESGIESFEIIDINAYEDLKPNPKDWNYIDEELLNKNNDNITIKVYFQDDEIIKKDEFLKKLKTKDFLNIEINNIDSEDWENNWKDFFETEKIGKNIIIKPSWEEYTPKAKEIIVELDPGMAFGTGGHETTSMCIELLENYLKKGDTLYDVGCGSGIISIVAKKLGAKSVLGTDLDSDAIKISRENAKINGVECNFEIGDLLKSQDEKRDIVVANIFAEILIELINDLDRVLLPNGYFICSGIIETKKDMVEEKLRDSNFEILDIKKQNEWVVIGARKTDE
ncbi:MAG: 50S ribosomal protein L11 methyltransferase [Tissierellia bacterium]|nr:50S ribosomal protein L11 methyltransferase [Tissierellia bacterium]